MSRDYEDLAALLRNGLTVTGGESKTWTWDPPDCICEDGVRNPDCEFHSSPYTIEEE